MLVGPLDSRGQAARPGYNPARLSLVHFNRVRLLHSRLRPPVQCDEGHSDVAAEVLERVHRVRWRYWCHILGEKKMRFDYSVVNSYLCYLRVNVIALRLIEMVNLFI